MAKLVTLEALIARVRRKADVEEEIERFPDAEVTGYVNEAIAKLWDILRGKFQDDLLVSSEDIAVTTGEAEMPEDFFSLDTVELKDGSSYTPIKRFPWRQQANLDSGPLRYNDRGGKLYVRPIPSSATLVRLWYVPTAPVLAELEDEFDSVNTFDTFVVLDAAIAVLSKDKEDTRDLARQLADEVRRIEASAGNRNEETGGAYQDVRGYGDC